MEPPKKYWFAQKRYGYGLTPCSWEGWLITLGLVVWLVLVALFTLQRYQTKLSLVIFIIIVALSSAFFLWATRSRTKGKLKWRWGEED